MPEIHRIRNAEIRVFDREPGTDDASDMYVLEVLGVTVRIRKVYDGPGRTGPAYPKIVVETGEWPLIADVCGTESTYGSEA